MVTKLFRVKTRGAFRTNEIAPSPKFYLFERDEEDKQKDLNRTVSTEKIFLYSPDKVAAEKIKLE